jgi:predicted SAM-dependent methyltransferase
MKTYLFELVRNALQRKNNSVCAEYSSETSKCRARLLPFCQGYGLDLGFGGDPISAQAIRVDVDEPYAQTGSFDVQLGGDAARLHWFASEALDYVYSSHLLEDFPDTKRVLAEWLRVIKLGGVLVLFCPDEQIYRAHCRTTGQIYNQNHKHDYFSLKMVKDILAELGNTTVIHENALVDTYSWELVAKKVK